MHPRQAIRDYVSALLLTLPSISKVQVGRTTDIPIEDLPYCSIETLSEEVGPNGLDGSEIRTLELVIIITARDEGNIYDVLDPIAEEIETAFSSDLDLGGNVMRQDLTQTTFNLNDEQPIGEARLNYSIQYINI